jgi:hypothetical protein
VGRRKAQAPAINFAVSRLVIEHLTRIDRGTTLGFLGGA